MQKFSSQQRRCRSPVIIWIPHFRGSYAHGNIRHGLHAHFDRSGTPTGVLLHQKDEEEARPTTTIDGLWPTDADTSTTTPPTADAAPPSATSSTTTTAAVIRHQRTKTTSTGRSFC